MHISNKQINWINQRHQKKKHAIKYMMYYNLFLLIKRKRNKRLIKDNVRIDNVGMRVIKWKRVEMIIQNRKLGDGGEREINDICYNYESSH